MNRQLVISNSIRINVVLEDSESEIIRVKKIWGEKLIALKILIKYYKIPYFLYKINQFQLKTPSNY